MSNPQDRSDGSSALFPLLALATIGTVIFGDYARDIAQWIVCAHAAFRDDECSATAIIDAKMIGTLVSSLVAILAAAIGGRMGTSSTGKARLLVVAALTGALLSILKASVGESKFPQMEEFRSPLLILLVIGTLFVGPLIFSRPSSTKESLEVTVQTAIALFLGLLLGGVVQIVAELFWQGTLHGTSVGKFVIAPMATVAGGAAFGVVLVHKRLRNGAVDLQWARAWFLIGALFAVLYVVLVYFPKHANGWMSGVLTELRALALLLGLLLPALASSMVAVLLSRKRIYRGVLLWSIIGAIVAGFAAWQMGQGRIVAEQLIPEDLPALILVHAVTPIVSAFVIVIVAKLIPRLIGFMGTTRKTA